MVRDSCRVYVVEWSLLRKAGWTGQVSGSRPVLNSKAKVQQEGDHRASHRVIHHRVSYHSPLLRRPQDELNAFTFQLGPMSELTPLKLPSCACG